MPFIRRTQIIQNLETTSLFIKNPEKNMAQVVIAFRIIPAVTVAALQKFLSHRYNFEIMQLNGLFTTLFNRTSHFKNSD